MLVIHNGAPWCQAAASSGIITSAVCSASRNERSASWMLRSAVEMRMCAIVSCARVGACSAGWLASRFARSCKRAAMARSSSW